MLGVGLVGEVVMLALPLACRSWRTANHGCTVSGQPQPGLLTVHLVDLRRQWDVAVSRIKELRPQQPAAHGQLIECGCQTVDPSWVVWLPLRRLEFTRPGGQFSVHPPERLDSMQHTIPLVEPGDDSVAPLGELGRSGTPSLAAESRTNLAASETEDLLGSGISSNLARSYTASSARRPRPQGDPANSDSAAP